MVPWDFDWYAQRMGEIANGPTETGKNCSFSIVNVKNIPLNQFEPYTSICNTDR